MNAQTLYEVLGVEETATIETIRHAYRTKAKTLHPDVSKDDAAQFNLIKHAHDVLVDADRRKLYDETGEARAARKPTDEEWTLTLALLSEVVKGIVDADGDDGELDVIDVPARVTKSLNARKSEFAHRFRVVNKKLRRIETLLKRLKAADPERDPLGSIIRGKQLDAKGELEQLEKSERVHDRATLIWADYTYAVERGFTATEEAQAILEVMHRSPRLSGGYRRLRDPDGDSED